MRQEFGEPGNGMGGDAGENILEPGEGFDFGPLAGSHKAPQHCGRVAALVATKECPIVAADSYTADRALRGIVVDGQVSVLAVAGQRLPVLQRVAHRPGGGPVVVEGC